VPFTPSTSITNGRCAPIASGGLLSGAPMLAPHLGDQPLGRVDADVGRQEARLELLDRRLVERLLA
jgi:hypothetical protein